MTFARLFGHADSVTVLRTLLYQRLLLLPRYIERSSMKEGNLPMVVVDDDTVHTKRLAANFT